MTKQKILRLPEVTERVGLKRTRIQELESEGRFPKRVKISDRAIGWYETDISKWVADRRSTPA